MVSAPHFFRGDPSLLEAVEGLNPIPDEHDTLLYIEPNSGAPVAAHKRIMVANLKTLSPRPVSLRAFICLRLQLPDQFGRSTLREHRATAEGAAHHLPRSVGRRKRRGRGGYGEVDTLGDQGAFYPCRRLLHRHRHGSR